MAPTYTIGLLANPTTPPTPSFSPRRSTWKPPCFLRVSWTKKSPLPLNIRTFQQPQGSLPYKSSLNATALSKPCWSQPVLLCSSLHRTILYVPRSDPRFRLECPDPFVFVLLSCCGPLLNRITLDRNRCVVSAATVSFFFFYCPHVMSSYDRPLPISCPG